MTELTYYNPVYAHNFPDPFVLKWCGEYWAYCTGHWHDGKCFGILHSRDLVNWIEVGGALDPLPGDLPHYWAPEVSVFDGRFYLYYSAGLELEDMAIRVAVADHPAGPFQDAGVRLTNEPFAIDAHVFTDEDGRRYLFYATDYLTHSHIGTGTAVAQMASPFELLAPSRPVTRAKFDWQVYEPMRVEKGGVRWHTIEGSFVLRHKGRYYQMFSGGNWQNVSYGVSYSVSDRILRPDEWEQHADGVRILPILQTIPERVVGPGHNSVVRGPDNRQLYCIYHRWMPAGRAMAIDPLDWVGERMVVLGPSDEERPVPNPPTFADYFDQSSASGLGSAWECEGGNWQRVMGSALQSVTGDELAVARCTVRVPCFIAEVSARAVELASLSNSMSGYGLRLEGAAEPLLMLLLNPLSATVLVRWHAEDGWREEQITLPSGFAPERFELLRAIVASQHVALGVGNESPLWSGRCRECIQQIALYTQSQAAEFKGFALTHSYENWFLEADSMLAADGWHIQEGALHAQAGNALLLMPYHWAGYELVLNLRVAASAPYLYAIYPLAQGDLLGPLLQIEASAAGWQAVWRDGEHQQCYHLPATYDPFTYQQWRFRRHATQLQIQWEGHLIDRVQVAPGLGSIAVAALDVALSVDLVRVTALAG